MVKQGWTKGLCGIVGVLGLTLCLITAVVAQSYKAGDRVEAKPMGDEWRKATVVIVDGNAAVVRMDGEKDASGAPREYTTHVNNLRPLSGETAGEKQQQVAAQAAADKNVLKLRVDANNTVLADRPILKTPVEQTRVANGSPPDPALLAKLIRAIWEKPATTGMDGAVTIDLTPLQIGTPRRFNPNSDLGGDATTIVYPVKTNYTMKTFYRDSVEVREYVGVFNCSIDPFGEWAAGMVQNKHRAGRRGTSPSGPELGWVYPAVGRGVSYIPA